ncbi:MAG: hypothetical protein K2G63_06720 [Oscillospiraceae bacterium]|nr:hypothetical protein [Oscillospiraceae bacterium]
MKKFLSAVTSVCMGISVLASSFAVPLSTLAAGGENPAGQSNVALGNLANADVTANKKADGDLTWKVSDIKITREQLESSKTGMFRVPVTVSKVSDQTIAAAALSFKFPDELVWAGDKAKKTCDAYGKVAVAINATLPILNFHCEVTGADGKAVGRVCETQDAELLQICFKIDPSTPDGVYPIEMYLDPANNDRIVADNDNTTANVTLLAGSITIGDADTTTTPVVTTTSSATTAGVAQTTQTTVTTKSGSVNPLPDGLSWKVDDITITREELEASKTGMFRVPVIVSKASDQTIAAAALSFKFPDELVWAGDKAKKTCDAYGKVAVAVNATLPILNFHCEVTGADGKAVGRVCETEGSELLQICFKIDPSTPDGVYPIEMYLDPANNDRIVADNDNNDAPVNLLAGSITIGDAVTTTSASTATTAVTTTTTKTTTVTTVAPPVQSGEIQWIIPDVTANPGDTVQMKVKVKGNDIAVAGMDGAVNVDSSEGIKLDSVSDESTGYTARVVANIAEELVAFDTKSAFNVKAIEDSDVFVLTYKVPANCKPGKYPVTWGSNMMIVDENQVDITSKVKLIDGSIEILSKAQEGEIEWVIPDVTANPGDTVTMDVKVKGDVIGVAGMDGSINVDSSEGIKLDSVSDESTGYTARVVANIAEELIAFDTKSAFNVKAADGSNVFTLVYTVPDNCKPGKYPVTWGSDMMIVDENQNDVTSNIKLTNGSIEILSKAQEGEIEWVIPEVTAKPGDTVTMDVKVKGDVIGVAGMDGSINVDKSGGIALSKVSDESTGYTARVVANIAEELIAFDTKSAFNVKAADGSNVVTLVYTVPTDCPAGKYPVTWGSDMMIVDENQNDVTSNIKLTDGYIEIVADTLQSGTIGWDIPEVTAKPGDTVELKVVVKGTDIAVAGMDGSINVDKSGGIALSDVSKESEGYAARVVANIAEELIAFDTKSAFNVAASDGATVFVLTYTVPADCPAGIYPVTWGSGMMIVDEKQNDITANVKLLDGSIEIVADTTTTPAATTTTAAATTTTAAATTTTAAATTEGASKTGDSKSKLTDQKKTEQTKK